MFLPLRPYGHGVGDTDDVLAMPLGRFTWLGALHEMPDPEALVAALDHLVSKGGARLEQWLREAAVGAGHPAEDAVGSWLSRLGTESRLDLALDLRPSAHLAISSGVAWPLARQLALAEARASAQNGRAGSAV